MRFSAKQVSKIGELFYELSKAMFIGSIAFPAFSNRVKLAYSCGLILTRIICILIYLDITNQEDEYE